MKTWTFLLLLGLALGTGCSGRVDQHAEASHQAEPAYEVYTCPMHPSVRSDRPGACPVCGMALVKKSLQQEMPAGDPAHLAAVTLSPTQRVLANIATEPVQRRTLVKKISAAGFLEAAEPLRALVTARFRGRVEHLSVSFLGERVAKGAPLFDLYSPELVSAQQEYLLAYRSATLPASASFGPSDLRRSIEDRLRLHYGMTDAQLAELSRMGTPRTSVTFHAPIGGTVLRKEVIEGQYVDEGTLLYEVADLSMLWVYFDVYEQDLAHVRAGQKISFTVEAFPGRTFEGSVDFVEPMVQPETRTVRVRVRVPNREGQLKPGMFATGEIIVTLEPALVVPLSALLSMGRSHVVWVEVADNAFEPRTVNIGTRTHDGVHILTGLREGERIAVTGGYLLDSESALRAPSAPSPHSGHQIHSSAGEPLIRIEGAYHPDTVHVASGHVRLRFFRNEESSCSKEIVIPGFGVHSVLAAFDTTVVEFEARQKGSFPFRCGMGMLHGVLIVE
ncbi:MAG: RND transporter [Bacteroidia bacterium]|nr:MAG: RND transporter [Bacteroidia bacterium]